MSVLLNSIEQNTRTLLILLNLLLKECIVVEQIGEKDAVLLNFYRFCAAAVEQNPEKTTYWLNCDDCVIAASFKKKELV